MMPNGYRLVTERTLVISAKIPMNYRLGAQSPSEFALCYIHMSDLPILALFIIE